MHKWPQDEKEALILAFAGRFPCHFYWSLCLFLISIVYFSPLAFLYSIALRIRIRGLLIFALKLALLRPQNLVKKQLLLLTFGVLNKPPGKMPRVFEPKRQHSLNYELHLRLVAKPKQYETLISPRRLAPKNVCYEFRRKVICVFIF